MKFPIAPQFMLGAKEFNIVFNDYLLAKMGDSASASMIEQKIRLPNQPVGVNIQASPELQFETLLHEISHMIDVTLGIRISERDTQSRAALLAQALITMGLEPDFSQIPEEKKIE